MLDIRTHSYLEMFHGAHVWEQRQLCVLGAVQSAGTHFFFFLHQMKRGCVCVFLQPRLAGNQAPWKGALGFHLSVWLKSLAGCLDSKRVKSSPPSLQLEQFPACTSVSWLGPRHVVKSLGDFTGRTDCLGVSGLSEGSRGREGLLHFCWGGR